MNKFFIVGILILCVIACDEDVNPFNDPSLLPPEDTINSVVLDPESFIGLHTMIFNPTCANSGCHDGTFEPDFRTIESSYNTLVYQPVIKNDANNTFNFRVSPGNSLMSVLYARLTYDIDGQSGIMPLSAEYHPEYYWYDNENEYIQNIKNWIDNGAPDMFGNMPSISSLPPQCLGVIAFADGSLIPLDRASIESSLEVPVNTTNLKIYFTFSDDQTQPQNLSYLKFKISENMFDFINEPEYNLNLVTPTSGEDYLGNTVQFYHMINISLSGFSVGQVRFFRVYLNDGNQPMPIEIPNNGSLEEIITHFSFITVD